MRVNSYQVVILHVTDIQSDDADYPRTHTVIVLDHVYFIYVRMGSSFSLLFKL